MKRPEILAPAGSIEALKAAVINGADAVYLGVGEFNARARAENFTLENLKQWVSYCHLYGVKVYLALNILFHDDELDAAVATAKSAIKDGIDAIILQDLALAERLKKETSAVLHASTQMGIHNAEGAIIAEKLGFSRIILSRETLLEDIKKIRQATSLEIETFVHGALCVAFSGNCYFSSLVSGNSGNRGKCMQLCRKKYKLTRNILNQFKSNPLSYKFILGNEAKYVDIEKGKFETGAGEKTQEKYWLSSKDLCLLKNLKDLADAGVTSFKIEGRMRKLSYIAEATRIYRLMLNGNEFTLPEDEYLAELSSLKRVFNRGNYTVGHLYDGTENITYPFIQSHLGKKIGEVKKIIGNQAELTCAVNKGDGLKFIRETGTRNNDAGNYVKIKNKSSKIGLNNEIERKQEGEESFERRGLQQKLCETGSALVQKTGNVTSFVGLPRQGDGVYITSSAVREGAINARTRKIKASFNVVIKTDCPICVSAKTGQSEVVLTFDPPLNAINAPLDTNTIREAFSRLGDTPFEMENIEIVCENAFLNKSALNEMRRKAAVALQEKILENYDKYRQKPSKFSLFMSDIVCKFPIIEKNTTILQIDGYLGNADDCFTDLQKVEFNKYDFICISPNDYSRIDINKIPFNKDKLILNLPFVARGRDMDILKRAMEDFDIVMANNLYAIALAKEKKIILSYGLNLLNNYIKLPRVMSLEYKGKLEQNSLFFKGSPPLMTFCHCLNKAISIYGENYNKSCDSGDTCNHCNVQYNLTDDKNITYYLRRYKIFYCYSQLVSDRIIVNGGKYVDGLKSVAGTNDFSGINKTLYVNDGK